MLPSRSLRLWTSQPGHEDSAGLQCLLRVYARHPPVRGLIQAAEEVLFSAVVVGEATLRLSAGGALRAEPGRTPILPRTSLRDLCTSRTSDCGPLFPSDDGTEGQGVAHSHQRRLDCSPRDGDRCRPCIGRQPLWVRQWDCLGANGSKLKSDRRKTCKFHAAP